MILVTGSTGKLGSEVIDHLLKKVKPENIVALARDEKKALKWKQQGVRVCIGDYHDKNSLIGALVGVEKLLLVTSSSNTPLEDHQNVIDAARQEGVKHLFYTSGARNTSVDESELGPLYDSYQTTEEYVKKSGIDFTIFQNGLYAETIPFFIGEDVLESGIFFPAEDGKASFAKRSEMGEAIANVLTGGGHQGNTYPLTGDKSFSFYEIARILSDLSGKKIEYESPALAEHQALLKKSGVSEEQINYLSLFARIIKNQEFDVEDLTLERLLGRKITSLKAYLKEVYS